MRNKKHILLFTLSFLLAATAHAQSIGVTLPTVPTGVTATVLPPSQATISWSASTESSGTIADYYLYRNGQQITTTPGYTSFIDSGLTPGVYIYTVAAADANGNTSAQSSPVSLSVSTYTTPPSTPGNVTVTGATTTNSTYTPTTLTISWNAATSTIAIAGYVVYRNGIQITSSTAAFTGTSITDTVLPGLYTYTVKAYDVAQNVSNVSKPLDILISVDNVPPSAPSNISAQQISATSIKLSWASSTDSIGIAGYQVFRNGTQIATVTGSPYADTGLSTGLNYAYALTAYDTAENISLRSTPIAATAQPTNGPSVPSIVSGVAIGTSSVKIAWSIPADILPITAYTVYRNNAQVATIAGTSTNYLDTNLATGTYAYNISATDISGITSATSSAMKVTVSGTVSGISVIIPSTALSVDIPQTVPDTANAAFVFTQSLYFGLRSTQVENLQSLLAQNGYLAPVYATGFFGNLTLGALRKFQCAENIVCTGGAGWGLVGPKTRAVLNTLEK